MVEVMDMELHQARSRGADMSTREVNIFRRIVKTGIQDSFADWDLLSSSTTVFDGCSTGFSASTRR